VPGNKPAALVARRPEVLTGSHQMSLARVTYLKSQQIDFLSRSRLGSDVPPRTGGLWSKTGNAVEYEKEGRNVRERK